MESLLGSLNLLRYTLTKVDTSAEHFLLPLTAQMELTYHGMEVNSRAPTTLDPMQ
jgi:hypothetical protein